MFATRPTLEEQAVETIQDGDFTAYIIPDDDPVAPWDDIDMLGKVAHWHPHYNIGGPAVRGQSPVEFLKEIEEEGAIYLPLGLLDHSGLHLYVGHTSHYADPGGWDSGPVGFYYVMPDDVRKEYGCRRIGKRIRQKVLNVLRAEVHTIDDYISGDVYEYVIVDKEGNVVESCCGYYPSHGPDEYTRLFRGFDPLAYLKTEIREELEYLNKENADGSQS